LAGVYARGGEWAEGVFSVIDSVSAATALGQTLVRSKKKQIGKPPTDGKQPQRKRKVGVVGRLSLRMEEEEEEHGGLDRVASHRMQRRLLYYSALLCSTLLYHHHGKVVRRLKTEGLARARSHTTADVQHLAST
jgi:hypothetical protein